MVASRQGAGNVCGAETGGLCVMQSWGYRGICVNLGHSSSGMGATSLGAPQGVQGNRAAFPVWNTCSLCGKVWSRTHTHRFTTGWETPIQLKLIKWPLLQNEV